MTRKRLRELGINIGEYPPGPHNAITDVPGVLVGHTTIIEDAPRVARTGVTIIAPNDGEIWRDNAFAGYHVFNGNGEMTGLPWLAESGLLGSPIAITNTHQVGIVRDSMIRYAIEKGYQKRFYLPVVAETYDGWLNDIGGFHVKGEHVIAALENASSSPVAEGNVGGGTGMICHEFKGGIGTASRRVTIDSQAYTVGALTQTNYGNRRSLRVDGVPIGTLIPAGHTPTPWPKPDNDGSIIVIIGTDAPLLPVQCQRLARRATIGLARVGGTGHNGSGDIFLAFATGNRLGDTSAGRRDLKMVRHNLMDPLIDAAAEAVEEAILNAITAADTMIGQLGRTAHALPLSELENIMRHY